MGEESLPKDQCLEDPAGALWVLYLARCWEGTSRRRGHTSLGAEDLAELPFKEKANKRREKRRLHWGTGVQRPQGVQSSREKMI